ncbi:MAG: phosphatidate cytidylyltransferase [Alphaproteobacteria bacterium]|nr:phosphatidate cytidylyltransferase [Alphaproteobacteria bacterium]
MADLGPRVLSAIIMAAIALVAIEAGAMVFDVLVAIGTAVLAWEWTRLCGGGRFGWTGVVQAVAVVAVVAAASFASPAVGVALIAAGCLGDYVAARISGRVHPRWIAAGTVYIGLPAIAIVWLRGAPSGQAVILWLMLSVWATDTGAYFAGRLVGGPKLAPRLSPKKTWAGLIGAALSAAVVGWILAGFDSGAPSPSQLAVAGAVLALVAQAGDLAKSAVKRRFGVKDSSHLIPGHGGLFDRVDGLLAAGLVLAVLQWGTNGAVLNWR